MNYVTVVSLKKTNVVFLLRTLTRYNSSCSVIASAIRIGEAKVYDNSNIIFLKRILK